MVGERSIMIDAVRQSIAVGARGQVGVLEFLHSGAADQKVPMEQSIRMADALKTAGKDVSFLRFGSGHGFSAEDNVKAFPEVARFLTAKLRLSR